MPPWPPDRPDIFDEEFGLDEEFDRDRSADRVGGR
jgi:hypothetical protein